ncbi:YgfZ/GcvT domain-containing protein [Mycolicibacterium hodleri]|uniref:Folate-binding protein n=1 Tax=Mycolicibacterium hodleri TaxID=49897 RepID=A0A502E2T2_9MYCO|nr:folate-binding protein YgfZ [Mycolicibacterium hodleri]TPG31913.1 folate-binding protein [Mycolicibacterium hodleri]
MSAIPAPETGPDVGATWHYGDPFGEQRAAETGLVVVDRSHRGTIALSGAERGKWLHTISTQHVSDLPDGAVVENLSLDAQGRVEDHWLQTEIGGVTIIDTEPWRGEPLLAYLRKMIFWADVVADPSELAVLSLLGPQIGDPAVLTAIGVPGLPVVGSASPLADGGFIRTVREGEVDLVVPRDAVTAWRERLIAAGARPAGIWAYEAHRAAALVPRLGVDTDERTIPHEVGWIGGPGAGAVHLDKGCYRGQETVARVHNLGKPPRMLVLLHLDGSADRPVTGDPVLAGGRAIGRLGTVVDHVDQGPIALALLKRGVPADTQLTTGGESPVSALIDPDSLPEASGVGAGRLAVERLRSTQR